MKLIVHILLLSLIVAGSCEDEGVAPQILDNSPPQIVEQEDTFTTVGDTLILYANAFDPNGNRISYSCFYNSSESPENIPNMHINMHTGEFTYIPCLADTVEGLFSLIACDSRDACDTTTFSVDVITDPGICFIFENCPIFGAWYFLDGEYGDLISSEEQTIVYLDPGIYEVFVRESAQIGEEYYFWETTVIVNPDKLSRLHLDCVDAGCPQ